MIEFRLILFGVSFWTVELGSSVIFLSNCIVNCCRQTDVVYTFSCTRRLGAILWRTTARKCNQSWNHVSPFWRSYWTPSHLRKPIKCHLKFRQTRIFCLDIKRTNDKQMSLLFLNWQLPINIHVKDVTNDTGIQISKSLLMCKASKSF